jgi:undecaprenyl-diphosphatase
VRRDGKTRAADKPLGLLLNVPLWLIVAAASLILFAWLSAEVLDRQSLAFDFAVRIAVHRQSTSVLTFLMRGLSVLGSAEVMFPLVLVTLAVMAGIGVRRHAILLVGTLTGAAVLELALKLAFHRTRPQPFFDYPLPDTYAFPSGHAMIALCFYTALAWILSSRLAKRWSRVAVWTVAGLLIGLIGLSRIYLGVHYPSDVLGGYAAGMVWMASVAKVRNWRSGVASGNSNTQDTAEISSASAAASALTMAATAFPFPDAGLRGHTKPHADRVSP